MAQELTAGMKELENFFEHLEEKFRESREALMDEAEEILLREVRGQVTATGINDSHGDVASWQVSYRGSGGGYVAVRARAGSVGPNSAGAVTNYLENGHRIRPAGKTKSRAKKIYVDGFHFYAEAGGRIESALLAAAERMGDKLGDEGI